jgi:two-component system nitrogen regulation response regulator GlnG
MRGISAVVEKLVQDYFTAQKNNITDSNLYAVVLKEVEKPLFEQTLHAVQGNKAKAARILGINRNTLHKKLSDMGL